MSQRLLILGANSFYGSNFAKLVAERGDEVIDFGGLFIDEDGRLCGFLSQAKDAVVVNFISRSLVAESWRNPREWAMTNVVGLVGMLEQLVEFKPRKFVHVSTPEVYGSTPGWVDESYTNWQPSTPYAVSRAAGDMMLKAYHKAYGFPMIITRTANIYGPGQQDFRIIPKAIAYKKRGEALPLHGQGESVRSFIHIKDACEATYKICKDGEVGETYHISTHKAHSILDVVDLIGCKYQFVEDRLGKDQAYRLNSAKLRLMGWKDTISLEEGICELLR